MRDHCSMGGTAVSLNLSPGFQEFDLFVVGQNARLCCTFNTPIGSPSLGLVTVTLIFWPPLWIFGCHLYFLAVSLTATLIFWLSPWISTVTLILWRSLLFFCCHHYSVFMHFMMAAIVWICHPNLVTLFNNCHFWLFLSFQFCHQNYLASGVISINSWKNSPFTLINRPGVGGWGDLCTVV
jgi:hypothetical protein